MRDGGVRQHSLEVGLRDCDDVADRQRQCGEAGEQQVPLVAGRRQPGLEQAVGHAERGRSEEHTSELQSLMRISYAVFCLKKKNKKTQKPYQKPYRRKDT